MFMLVRSIVSWLVCRFRSRAVVELENLELCHQLQVLRRQRPGRLRLFTFDRLLWVRCSVYRLWPRCLEAMVLVTCPAKAYQVEVEDSACVVGLWPEIPAVFALHRLK